MSQVRGLEGPESRVLFRLHRGRPLLADSLPRVADALRMVRSESPSSGKSLEPSVVQPTFEPGRFRRVAFQFSSKPEGMPAGANPESNCIHRRRIRLNLADGVLVDLQKQVSPDTVRVSRFVPGDDCGFRVRYTRRKFVVVYPQRGPA